MMEIRGFLSFCKVNRNGAEFGGNWNKFGKIAKEILTDFLSRTNLFPLETSKQIMEILELAK